MQDLKPLEFPPQEPFEKLQKRASAYCGFDLSKPADLSALQVDRIQSEVKQWRSDDEDDYLGMAFRQLSFTLTTKLRGWLSSEDSEEELIITIERRNVKKLPKTE